MRARLSVDAAVLVPVYRDRAGDMHVVLVVRTEHGRHGGQIAFPGGIHSPADADLRETALREAHEEIGLERGSVEVVATLPQVDTTTGYVVTPFLARLVTEPPAWQRQEREIAEVLSVALTDLAREDLRGEEMWDLPRGRWLVRFVRLGRHTLWGATYRILEPLIPRLLAGEWAI
jgi:8-oxo-dGTP pyrophosphatase MutT (NUDIX family)